MVLYGIIHSISNEIKNKIKMGSIMVFNMVEKLSKNCIKVNGIRNGIKILNKIT